MTTTHHLIPATLALFSAVSAAFLAGGCTTITIQGPADAVTIERRLGFATVKLEASETPIIGEVQALGVLSGPLGIAFGAGRQELVLAPLGCSAVFWVDSAEQAAAITSAIDPGEGLCVLTKEGGQR